MEDKEPKTPAEAGTETPETQAPEAQASEAEVKAPAAETPAAEPAEAEAPEAAPAAEPAAPAEMTMEQALQEAESRLGAKVRRGQVLTGRVVFVGSEGVAVDVGAKVEGIIPFNQLTEEPLSEEELKQMLKPGDEVEVYVVRVDLPNNVIILSKKRAEADKAWRKIVELAEKGEPVEVTVREKVRGGLVAYLEGVRAFIPASQVDIKRVAELDEFVGQTIPVKITEINRKKGRVILSRRVLLEEDQKKKRAEVLEGLEPGAEVEGKVVEVTDFGAFVNLGAIDGLIHRSELSWGRFEHPREVVKVGDVVKAKVLSVDRERERVNLSIKALTPDPWQTAAEKYEVGQRIKGKVVGLTPFGAFVEIEPGLEGLIHITEMSWTKRPRHPSEVLKEGEEVEAVVLRIDPEQRRLSLGLRQTLPDPWKELPEKYPPGTVVKGKITGVTDFGVFVEIEDGIEGLVHISELDYEHIDNPAEKFKKGEELEVVVLNIDATDQRVSLSRKRLLPPPVPTEDEEQEKKRRPRQKKAKGGPKRGGPRGPRRERELPGIATAQGADLGSFVGGESNTSVKLGDLYGDLLADLGLEEEAPAEPAGESEA
ncbi:30S ribosomal protein S1 [Oceanithermus desulfurans]|uniref:Small ribosomal subunit protein bS1 n=3 Tax=Oceanithermus TaxID=208447 RepID=A0A511RHA0_9DEIN|nr:30S ribosomal protein S1 [Oceanithermus desulfurans]MBB6029321.1 small subunit ribosomal protein S1 [Oceanithermus desulfurans]GEM89041.1 30S ribosomal protein S1 [Oceanithermus desulfurans NBRC 100063]